MSLAVVDGVMHGAGGEDSNDQNLEMMMVYDNSRQIWTQVRHIWIFDGNHREIMNRDQAWD